MNTTGARKLFVTLATATALSFPTPRWRDGRTALGLHADCLAGHADHLRRSSRDWAGTQRRLILYALGGRDEQAGRLFGSAIGGCIALAIVYLLNYVLP